MSRSENCPAVLLGSPVVGLLIKSVDAEERVIEAIISSVENSDAEGLLRAASELMVLRRSSTDDHCAG
jgi:hypothetical protein